MNIFEKATRMKLRFSTKIGMLSVEDLFDIPLTSKNGEISLDDMARGYFQAIKADKEVCFVPDQNAVADSKFELIKLKFDIVKHIIDVKLAEREKHANARALRDRQQKLLHLIANKQDEALSAKSVEELQKMLEELI